MHFLKNETYFLIYDTSQLEFSENERLCLEFWIEVQHMEIVEWHMMTISTEDKKAVSKDNTSMTIPSLRSFSWRFCHGIVITACWSTRFFSIESSFSNLSIAFFKTGIRIFYQKWIFHSDRCWRLQFYLSLIDFVCSDRGQSDFGLLCGSDLLIFPWRGSFVHHILGHAFHSHGFFQTDRIWRISKILWLWWLLLGRIQFLK